MQKRNLKRKMYQYRSKKSYKLAAKKAWRTKKRNERLAA